MPLMDLMDPVIHGPGHIRTLAYMNPCPSTLVGPPPHLIWGAAGASPRVAITRNVALVQGCARGSDAGAHTIGARVRVGAGQAIIAGRA